MQRFRVVHYVSDGGPKHFKTKGTIFFVCVQLPRKFGLASVTYHFWLSNHGKWVYDAMAAVLKRQILILGRAERRAVAGAEEYVAVANSKVRNMTGEAFRFVNQSATYAVAGFDDTGLRKYHAFRCLDFAGPAPADRVYNIQCKVTSKDARDPLLVTRARPAFDVGAGLDLSELDVQEKTGDEAVQAGRAAAEARVVELEKELRSERRADIWADVRPGLRVAARFLIDGRVEEVRGTVLEMGRAVRPDTGEQDDNFKARFDDGDEATIFRYKDDYRLLDVDELAAEATAEAERAVSRRGRAISKPSRYRK
jgi:hypothetical protein